MSKKQTKSSVGTSSFVNGPIRKQSIVIIVVAATLIIIPLCRIVLLNDAERILNPPSSLLSASCERISHRVTRVVVVEGAVVAGLLPIRVKRLGGERIVKAIARSCVKARVLDGWLRFSKRIHWLDVLWLSKGIVDWERRRLIHIVTGLHVISKVILRKRVGTEWIWLEIARICWDNIRL